MSSSSGNSIFLNRPLRIAAIIQARMSSSRLPGKVLADIGGQPMLAHIIRRAQRATLPDEVIVATSDQAEDNPVAELAVALKAGLFRGSLEDVLDRYVRAAEQARADVVIRITGDCPFLEPRFIDHVVHYHLTTQADYTGARREIDFPRGTVPEVVSLSALRRAWYAGRTPPDREHVTWYILSHRNEFRVAVAPSLEVPGLPGVHLVVDTPADLALAREIFARLSVANPKFGVKEILALHACEPGLFQINAQVARNPLPSLD